MSNTDGEAAWRYHNGTKHPRGRLMDPRHVFDPRRTPLLLKTYADAEPSPLQVDTSPRGVSALSAISALPAEDDAAATPDIDALARVLFFSAGVTKRLRYRGREMRFRAAACTGALYHIELYVVCGDLPGLEAGVYHFGPDPPSLTRLRKGDRRGVLVRASGGERAVAEAPAILIYTDVFWRNACKYQARAYRHAFWDTGTILAHTLAVAAAHGLPVRVVAGFVDSAVNLLLGLEPRREAAIAMAPLGRAPNAAAQPAPDAPTLALQTVPSPDREVEFPAITKAHRETSLATGDEVAAWRGHASPTAASSPAGRLYPLEPGDAAAASDPLEEVIVRRGSTRRFSRAPITFAELSTVLRCSLGGVAADFLSPGGTALNDVYLIVNSVDGLPPGAYFYHRDVRALELLKEGEFRGTAGHLGLDQELPRDASIDVFFLANLGGILAGLGNRGYRAAQLDASIAAGRMYLAAHALGLGATGLTFYDDEVTEFFSPHALGQSPMFMMAVGRRAVRRRTAERDGR